MPPSLSRFSESPVQIGLSHVLQNQTSSIDFELLPWQQYY